MKNNRGFDNEMVAVAVPLLREQYRDEIERAISNAKRLPWDKWCRRQFYRAAAQRRWRRDQVLGRISNRSDAHDVPWLWR